MKTIMAFFCMIITVVIVVAAFGCGYQLGADNTEQKYSDDMTTRVTENATEDATEAKTKELETRIDNLNRKVVALTSENNELKRLLQQERNKGVMDKMSDNLSAAADGAVELWDNIVD